MSCFLKLSSTKTPFPSNLQPPMSDSSTVSFICPFSATEEKASFALCRAVCRSFSRATVSVIPSAFSARSAKRCKARAIPPISPCRPRAVIERCKSSTAFWGCMPRSTISQSACAYASSIIMRTSREVFSLRRGLRPERFRARFPSTPAVSSLQRAHSRL